MNDAVRLLPRSDTYAADVAHLAENLPIFAFWRMKMGNITPGHVTLSIDFRDELGAAADTFQGTVTGAIADMAGTLSAATLLDRANVAFTIDYTIKFLAPARGARLIGRGRVIRPGAAVSFCAADVFVDQDGVEAHVATALLTTRNVPFAREELHGRRTRGDAP